jgi:alanyl-tRNA synthetase
MGLERTARVLGDFQSVYDTDVFSPIIAAIAARANSRYGEDPEIDRAMRIIADHMRTASFCIADGILPSNTGRGYVLRRLIRRSILKGTRTLNIEEAFIAQLFDAVVAALGDPYIELAERAEAIKNTLSLEESAFLKTMKQGHEKFDQIMGEKGAVDGSDAFFLYDTFGFPFEVTQELAQELNQDIDEDEFRAALKEAQSKSRAARGAGDVFGGEGEAIVLATAHDAPATSTFVGYDRVRHATRLVQISPRFGKDNKTTGDFQICLEETPFYAESGGQVGDAGVVEGEDFAFQVSNTWQEMGQVWHDGEIVRFDNDLVGLDSEQIGTILQSGVFFASVLATVDASRRLHTMRNHTATHLLHAALRERLGTHVTQAGSLVAPDRLRFDFTHGKGMSPEEVRAVEESVNRHIASALPVRIHWNVPIGEARKLGAMMLFGEKYGEFVRVVDIPGYSVELCGGTHVNNIAEIGMFRILSESSSAGGVRRIEAVTGFGAYQAAAHDEDVLKATASALKTQPDDIPAAISRLQAKLKESKKREAPGSEFSKEERTAGQFTLHFGVLHGVSAGDAKTAVDRLAEADPAGIGFVAVLNDGRVSFYCKAGKQALASGAHAGNLVKTAAKVAGGGGGGSAEFAQAGGKDPSKVTEAIDAVAAVLAEL